MQWLAIYADTLPLFSVKNLVLRYWGHWWIGAIRFFFVFPEVSGSHFGKCYVSTVVWVVT